MEQQASELEIRNMRREELDLAVAWAAGEGWNPGLSDADAFWAADAEGFFIGLLNGEPVASASLVRYQGGFSFFGFFIVVPEHRKKGYGMAISTRALQGAGQGVCGLDGVEAQQDNYRKMGFTLAYNNMRFAGVGGGEAPAGLVPCDEAPWEELAAYDLACFGYPREAFLQKWLHQPQGAALALVRGGTLAGFGVMRPCREGYKIGPLFADDPKAAQDLFAGLAAKAPERPIFLDTPAVNPAAVEMAQTRGMEVVFRTARMYMNGDPGLPVERIFGVSSFELG